MDLIRLRSELQRLSEIVGGWNAPEEISALERDLVLEKLRGLYDAVRFGRVADAQLAEEPAPEAAFPIDLGEVLSLDPAAGAAAVPDDGPDFGGVAAEETSVAGLPEIRSESAPGACRSRFGIRRISPGSRRSRSGIRTVRVRLCAGDGAVCTRNRSGCGVRSCSGIRCSA